MTAGGRRRGRGAPFPPRLPYPSPSSSVCCVARDRPVAVTPPSLLGFILCSIPVTAPSPQQFFSKINALAFTCRESEEEEKEKKSLSLPSRLVPSLLISGRPAGPARRRHKPPVSGTCAVRASVGTFTPPTTFWLLPCFRSPPTPPASACHLARLESWMDDAIERSAFPTSHGRRVRVRRSRPVGRLSPQLYVSCASSCEIWRRRSRASLCLFLSLSKKNIFFPDVIKKVFFFCFRPCTVEVWRAVLQFGVARQRTL